MVTQLRHHRRKWKGLGSRRTDNNQRGDWNLSRGCPVRMLRKRCCVRAVSRPSTFSCFPPLQGMHSRTAHAVEDAQRVQAVLFALFARCPAFLFPPTAGRPQSKDASRRRLVCTGALNAGIQHVGIASKPLWCGKSGKPWKSGNGRMDRSHATRLLSTTALAQKRSDSNNKLVGGPDLGQRHVLCAPEHVDLHRP